MLTCHVPAVSAQQADRAAIRALVPMPLRTFSRCLALSFGLGYSNLLGYAFFWQGQKYPAEIARIQQQLRQAQPTQRALLYRQLGELYHAQGDSVAAQSAFGTAVSLYAGQLTQTHARSHDGRFLAEYALALEQAGQTTEAEKQARTAVRLAPRTWQTRAALGQVLEKNAKALTVANRATVTGKTVSSTAQAAWQKARRAFDTAVTLAPHLPQPYEMRASFHWALAFATVPSFASSVAGLSDLAQAVALRPHEPYALALLAWDTYEDYGIHYFPGQAFDNFAVWKVLPQAKKSFLLRLRRRIERLTVSRDVPLRARSYVALAWLEYEFHDVPPLQAQTHLQRALMLAPDLPEAEQLLMHTYAVEDQWAALVHFCVERGQRHPDVLYDLTAVYADFKLNQFARAEAQTRAALKLKPDDLAVNLLLTYLFLRSEGPENHDQERLQAAGHCLDAADARLMATDHSTPEFKEAKAETASLRGYYYLLLGKQDEARQQFMHVLDSDKDNAAARQGLALLQ